MCHRIRQHKSIDKWNEISIIKTCNNKKWLYVADLTVHGSQSIELWMMDPTKRLVMTWKSPRYLVLKHSKTFTSIRINLLRSCHYSKPDDKKKCFKILSIYKCCPTWIDGLMSFATFILHYWAFNGTIRD